jgi:hypothetical protein
MRENDRDPDIEHRNKRALFEAQQMLGTGNWNLNKLIRILEGAER